jgi:hypothetical protein
LAAISIGQREFEQWNLGVSALRCVPSGSKSRHFKRQASQEFWAHRDDRCGPYNGAAIAASDVNAGADVDRAKAPSRRARSRLDDEQLSLPFNA